MVMKACHYTFRARCPVDSRGTFDLEFRFCIVNPSFKRYRADRRTIIGETSEQIK